MTIDDLAEAIRNGERLIILHLHDDGIPTLITNLSAQDLIGTLSELVSRTAGRLHKYQKEKGAEPVYMEDLGYGEVKREETTKAKGDEVSEL